MEHRLVGAGSCGRLSTLLRGVERMSVGLVLGTLLGPEGVAVAMNSGDLRVGRTARTELSGFRAGSVRWCG